MLPRSAALPQEAGAANAVCLYDPTREKANRENPQIFPIGKFKIILPLNMARAQAEAISNHFFFSCSASPSRGVTYTVVYTSYSTMPGFAPLAFQMFFTSVVSTATLAAAPAL